MKVKTEHFPIGTEVYYVEEDRDGYFRYFKETITEVSIGHKGIMYYFPQVNEAPEDSIFLTLEEAEQFILQKLRENE